MHAASGNVCIEFTFAGLEAFGPRVIEFRAGGSSAVLGPRTAWSATTTFAGFLDGAALGAYRTDWRCTRCRSHICSWDVACRC